MKNILLLLIILFASCKKEDSSISTMPIQGNVIFTVDRIKLPTQVAVISIDNISAGAIIGNDTLNVKTKDTLIHQYQVILYDPILPKDTISGQFKARNRQTVKVVIPNE
jgi:hypothetical protein